mmetsp:Transcript_16002/g.43891  ORF Transcript_16002/g.43891 Transcript_16002/m.43891 type:complete len:200 (-) Transcript_16002:538-1137(-)
MDSATDSTTLTKIWNGYNCDPELQVTSNASGLECRAPANRRWAATFWASCPAGPCPAACPASYQSSCPCPSSWASCPASCSGPCPCPSCPSASLQRRHRRSSSRPSSAVSSPFPGSAAAVASVAGSRVVGPFANTVMTTAPPTLPGSGRQEAPLLSYPRSFPLPFSWPRNSPSPHTRPCHRDASLPPTYCRSCAWRAPL